MYDAELAFVEALRDATNCGAMTWVTKTDDERDIYQAEVDDAIIEVEFMFFRVANGDSAERVVATVSGMKTYFQVAIGTPVYHILKSIFANKKAWESSAKNLKNATERARRSIELYGS